MGTGTDDRDASSENGDMRKTHIKRQPMLAQFAFHAWIHRHSGKAKLHVKFLPSFPFSLGRRKVSPAERGLE